MADLVVDGMSYQDYDTDPPLSVQTFNTRGSIAEGISGQAAIDTTFENTEKPDEWV